MCEIIRIDTQDDNDVETNFQKASCTLEAGVKIYASRVDSVHSKAYKVLGGINRAGRDDIQEKKAVYGPYSSRINVPEAKNAPACSNENTEKPNSAPRKIAKIRGYLAMLIPRGKGRNKVEAILLQYSFVSTLIRALVPSLSTSQLPALCMVVALVA
ncbi:hypothetical protein IFM89_036350 [Coptis chinensis]|uniref:Condensin complex subunit 2 n=1 Tax=Coptis chinensis TaxID=261450 RepID=A0A835HJ13_9MAGN|nr:hypothetical protein IFM89_036350 [Coptis chinensis]